MEVGGDSVWFPWGGIAGSIETDGFGFFKQLDVMNGKERMRVTGTFLCDIDNGADSRVAVLHAAFASCLCS